MGLNKHVCKHRLESHIFGDKIFYYMSQFGWSFGYCVAGYFREVLIFAARLKRYKSTIVFSTIQILWRVSLKRENKTRANYISEYLYPWIKQLYSMSVHVNVWTTVLVTWQNIVVHTLYHQVVTGVAMVCTTILIHYVMNDFQVMLRIRNVYCIMCIYLNTSLTIPAAAAWPHQLTQYSHTDYVATAYIQNLKGLAAIVNMYRIYPY